MKLEYIVGIIVILFAVQFLYGVAANPDSEFGGADGAAEDVIASINPDYEPWFGGIGFEPPGGETESLLFALQAAFGAVIIGYVIGYYKGKSEAN
ncbi:energy-coupling factor ABC transporter substrate-binding protein [Methanolobus zinderi]|jgi:cobalt/nickel transport protein|uniref:Cobalt transport protein CbiN n=1 Tax=Methanolobus zinderi TaxID=536044 RepID=A0A7D5ICL6_9EURY|nr:energy-coupling factor ABC transporter substrate-binding protein [Methanolobus zinderi]QLC50849.1 energy-coupling factor ABC transporter substrate-binding protein [Methanolobus zinderi]